MALGITIILLFVVAIAVLVFKYESPPRRPGKISGRGGDFTS
ncbi:MAG: hypothetical protein NTV96_00105 [Actinobacteria bacterium]|nr:hypothetical protein [Actinomycetota bacterium]